MSIQTKYFAILPILNQRFTTFRGPSWWLAENIQIKSLNEAEQRLIEEQSPKQISLNLMSGQKALFITDLRTGAYNKIAGENEKTIRSAALASQVTMNLVGEKDPLIFPYGFLVGTAFISQIKDTFEFGLWGDSITLGKQRYMLTKGVNLAEVSELYSMSLSAINKAKDLRVTLNRFCSSLIKQNGEDKLIDLSISLESLVPGGGEFKFRFPYFLSLISEAKTNERRKNYDLLEKLYDARSGLVHGSDDRSKQIKDCLSKWNELVQIARQCILYRIVAETIPGLQWKTHLHDLAYGKEPLLG